MKEKVFYFYTPDTSVTEDGKKNPIPAKLRQRRQIIAAIIKDNHLIFGKSECNYRDLFNRKQGKNLAKGRALSTSQSILKLEISGAKEVSKLFVEAAKGLVTAAPVLEQVMVYKRAK